MTGRPLKKHLTRMDQQLKEKVQTRIKSMGIKKAHLAKQMGIGAVQFSQIMSGKRIIQPDELSVLKRQLGL
jgi:transcriptional regulator with XRE-family HTH domain